MKICTRCNQGKPLSEFVKDKNKKGGYRNQCKECKKEDSSKYYDKVKTDESFISTRKKYRSLSTTKEYHKNYSREYYHIPEVKEKQKDYREMLEIKEKRNQTAIAHNYKKLYGITPEQKNDLIRGQDYKCLGCNKLFDLNDKFDICVDHCHSTGKIRGILCRKCNSILGFADDNQLTLKNLSDYLAKNI